MGKFLIKDMKFIEKRISFLKEAYLRSIISDNAYGNYFNLRLNRVAQNYFIYPNVGVSNVLDHRENYCSTFNEAIDINFFEQWQQIDKNKYCLISTNFNFKRIVDGKHINFISLHSEPNDTSKSKNIYKICPHMHFDFAFEPINHAHVGLFAYEIKKILNSFSSYDKAIKIALDLLKNEILIKMNS